MSAPTLSRSFVEALKLSFKYRGFWAFIPWLAALFLVAPQYYGPEVLEFLQSIERPLDIGPISAALLVMGGFLGAVSVNVLREIFSLISDEHFAEYLIDLELLDQYIFWPQFILLIQLLFIVTCAVTLGSYILLGLNEIVARAFIFNVGAMFYTVLKTWNLVDMVRKLAWHRQDFLSDLREALAKAEQDTE